jgi:DNA polymerase-3 subunit gamma/tau
MSLTLEFRPATFGDVVGQPWVSLVLDNMVRQGEVPSALVFHGERGTGKTSTARILAAALNCERENRPCLECDSCNDIRKTGSVDVIEIDAATNGRAEDMRKLCDMLTYDVGSRNRVVIIDEAHGLSPAAFDALLKPSEEPPERVTFVFVTTEVHQIPKTIMSRCMDFRFKRISARHVTARLQMIRDAKGFTVGDDLLACIAERADGGMRDAVKLLDQAVRAGVTSLQEFYDLTGEGDFAPGLVAAMQLGKLGDLYEMTDRLVCDVGDPQLITTRLVQCLRDMLVLRAGGTNVTAQGEALQARKFLASRATDIQIVGALRVLWDTAKVRGSFDARTVLDLAVVMCSEQFAPQRNQVSANGNGNGHSKASMQDIKALVGT